MTIEQAIRTAVEAERAAARFYTRLTQAARDERTRSFLQDMSEEEEEHAQAISRWGEELGAQYMAAQPDPNAFTVETAPAWEQADYIDLRQALAVAVESEHHAALYYDAMSDGFEGESAAFFKRLAKQELGHARRLQELRKWVGAAPG